MSQTTPGLSPQAELHYTRGMLHLRRGEAILPASMAIPEEKTAPGADVFLALLGLATVATSRALGQTGWIERYREEMRTALTHFDQTRRTCARFRGCALSPCPGSALPRR